jgi:hypothetical protein
MHKATARFWSCFRALPEPVQRLASKNDELLKENRRHPSLHFKKIGKLWCARVGRHHRALAIEDGSDFVSLWIGTHQEYDRLLGG